MTAVSTYVPPGIVGWRGDSDSLQCRTVFENRYFLRMAMSDN